MISTNESKCCECDLDNWQPPQNGNGHTSVCPLFRVITDEEKEDIYETDFPRQGEGQSMRDWKPN